MKRIKIAAAVMLAGSLTFSASEAQMGAKANTRGRIFEINVTNNLNIASGEPEIAIDPRDPRNLAIIEFALGSAEVPAWSLNPLMDVRGEKQAAASMRYTGRVMLSSDGGNTWAARPAPAYDSTRSPGGGDPMIAYGPDGSLYAADEPLPNPAQRAHMYADRRPQPAGQRRHHGPLAYGLAAASERSQQAPPDGRAGFQRRNGQHDDSR